MTPEQITVPRATWDAMIEALEIGHDCAAEVARETHDKYRGYKPARHAAVDENADKVLTALTAAKAVSHQKPETTPAPEGGAITAESARAMVAEMDMNDRVLAAIDAEPQAQITPHIDGTGTARGVLAVFNPMEQPLGWYCVSRDGLATQCADQRDAEMTAKSANRDWPNSAPYRAVQLCEYAHHQEAPCPAHK